MRDLTHFLIIVLITAAISIIDGRSLIKNKLHKELYGFAAFAVVILVYAFMYFSNSYNVSIASIFDKIVVHK